ncbi:hypothetical protein [Xenorhabdus indica]|uniref:hypothetical protein n=1 Tax=Xenorhabdus indica TaxID=333964 RepID=UPI0016572F19|nr:hypothetical protein [Xenorhabdus indica]MBC8946797.1 hypothetical protein [Xenorhabdus indica]
MAKKTQQEPGGLPPELQVETDAQKLQTRTEPQQYSGDENEKTTGENTPEFVVAKGHTVRHNGTDYPENTVIEVFGDDASRLIQLGVIMRLDDLRAQLLSSNPVTVQGGINIQRGTHAD